MADGQGLVTPEAVLLELPDATVGSRGAALLVDWLLQILLGVAVLIGAAFVPDGLPSWIATSLALILGFLILFGYPIGFETVTRGRTPGKRLLGLRVVTVEGAPVRFRHAAVRAAVGLVDFSFTFGLAAVLSSLLSRRNQRLGDFAAGTVVVRERVAGDATPQRFSVPPGAEAVAETLDVSGLATRDYAAVRTYLLRADSLAPDRADAIARELVAALAPRLGVHPDATGLSPRRMLEVIAARYQQRAADLEVSRGPTVPGAPPR